MDVKFSHKCDYCDDAFSTLNGMSRHRSRMHKSNITLTCSICSKDCKNNSKLMVHMRSHTGEKPYKCDSCIKSFSTKGNLNAHVLAAHSKEVVYKCNRCNDKFLYKTSLTRHKRSSCYKIDERPTKRQRR